MILLPPVPERVRWLFTEQEKQIAIRRSKQAFNTPHSGFQLKQLRAVLTDHKIWFYGFLYCMTNVSLSGFSSFLPVILETFGYGTLTTQVLTIPVYVATAVSTIAFAYTSDKLRKRGYFLTASFALAGLGWLLLLVSKSQRLSLAACFLTGMGTFPTVALIQAWQTSNVIGYTKRAGALAFLMVFGQSFSILEVEIFGNRPNYYPGKGLALTGTVAAAVVTPLFQLYLKQKNRQKLANQDSEEAAAKRGLGIEDIGDDHPDFIYWL
ncbi:uncharacterized protein N7459_001675 [Penicillium hispanicum]|uniref:uncharacterized protein n=1 Tax=Penicillium hispanicum TaxID=1080232 RepID=UPI00254228CB|nr:uncharacterized protein N7459_001675 [Penicillium hispanicum]KAJ5595467.1 hypothetical protein N7459_001675 [Penicillium hispanicum]